MENRLPLISGTIFKSYVAGPSTSKAEAENTKSARCKICLKEDSINKKTYGHNVSGRFRGADVFADQPLLEHNK